MSQTSIGIISIRRAERCSQAGSSSMENVLLDQKTSGAVPLGSMYREIRTPDGYYVDKDGYMGWT